jgi:hypothetical protein
LLRHLRCLHLLASHHLRRHSSPGRVPAVPLAAAAAARGDRMERVEARPWVRERGKEKEAFYIFLTKSRSRFYCGKKRTCMTQT